MQIVLFPVFLGVAESFVGYVSAVVLVLSVSFQSFVLQHNVHYRVIPLVCNIRNQSHMIVSQQEETRVISSTFNAALSLFLTG